MLVSLKFSVLSQSNCFVFNFLSNIFKEILNENKDNIVPKKMCHCEILRDWSIRGASLNILFATELEVVIKPLETDL